MPHPFMPPLLSVSRGRDCRVHYTAAAEQNSLMSKHKLSRKWTNALLCTALHHLNTALDSPHRSCRHKTRLKKKININSMLRVGNRKIQTYKSEMHPITMTFESLSNKSTRKIKFKTQTKNIVTEFSLVLFLYNT